MCEAMQEKKRELSEKDLEKLDKRVWEICVGLARLSDMTTEMVSILSNTKHSYRIRNADDILDNVKTHLSMLYVDILTDLEKYKPEPLRKKDAEGEKN